ncbi:amino acid permease [Mycoplasmopsis gallinacea]|uniref:Amino acid permease n=1 Tax=Mycoplasmopsis gallinacea TaxID=29556 RepID=A0A449A497_9BACT|nr:amino acid permease [Mycoplasmopsis gallinacea]VEU59048.1 Amino acid permease [Mycoplasmopsis gallinacea]
MNTQSSIKAFSEKNFIFFTINFIVGFGFVSTILTITNLKALGLLTILLTSFITLGIVLVFSRLAAVYSEEYGGSYYYAKKIGDSKAKKLFAFWVGWSQFMQGPILSAAGPLFLATAISVVTDNQMVISIVRGISFLFYILLMFISTFGLKLSTKVIYLSAIIKWTIIFLALLLSVYLAFKNPSYSTNFSGLIDKPKSEYAYLIFKLSNFIYVCFLVVLKVLLQWLRMRKTNKIKKVLFLSFGFIVGFYLVFYLVLLGINSSVLNGQFSNIFLKTWSITGLVIFVIGTIFNQISSKISTVLVNSRQLIPLAEDGYLPKFLIKTNSRGEYRNAIYFSLGLTIFSLIVFWALPEFLNLKNFFLSVIEIGNDFIFSSICAHFHHSANFRTQK